MDAQVLSVSFASTQMLALLPTGTVTGLVVDCGYHETSVLPVRIPGPILS
jgi:actin-related protein 10